MAKAAAELPVTDSTDFSLCEYVPFGAKDTIKLSFNIIRQWLVVKTAKGAMPNEQDVMDFLMTCKEMRLNPWAKDAYLIGYDGKDGPVFSTIVAHQAFLKRAETHPEFDGMESGVIVQSGDKITELVGDFFPQGSRLLGGWATVFFVNRRHPMTKRLKLSTFDKGRSLWKTNPEGMIVKCAEADALRSSFPQLCGGMYLRDEMDSANARQAQSEPLQLRDGRGEEVPFPAANGSRERVFADRGGVPVSAAPVNRYPQDAAAAEVSERIQSQDAAFHVERRWTAEKSQEETAARPETRRLVFEDVLNRCRLVDSVAAAEILSKEIAAHLAGRSLTDEQACDLNGALEDRVQNLE